MTQTLGTNSNNDIYLGADGNLVMLSGLQAVLAACQTAARAQLNEMVLAQGQGIPNFQAVWIGVPNYDIFAAYLQTTLENVEGVNQVLNLTVNPVQKVNPVSGLMETVLNYTATIQTIYGESILTGGVTGSGA